MTEQEAMQNAYGTSGWRNSESVFNSGWKAALEWARSEQEPCGYINTVYEGGRSYSVHFSYEPDGGTFDSKPVYKHPAPVQPVRLSDDEIEHLNHYSHNRFDFANEIQDAMLAKGAAQKDVSELLCIVQELAASSTADSSLVEQAQEALAKWEGKE